ncbi:MAG: N-acetyltransferase [Bacteroidaceae bacterium]|nr:N-acetyltransferase [Bacteroidaceae bacterium]MBR6714672.1 N-acetyltransferase [Bacteroidaceae bacterium]
MMTTVHKVTTSRELKKFARFNYKLYKDNPYSVPDLYSDILKTFSREKNPAFEFCEAEYFLAYQDGKIVGRVAAIINHRANATWGKKAVRFGWIDFIDDLDVSRALLKAVEQWGADKGMTTMEGPLGFTDMDAEGMLIEGFEELSTMATIYNYPYYPEHMEKLGLGKAIDWVEMKLMVPEKLPEQYEKIARIVQQRLNLHVRKLRSVKEIRRTGVGYKIFDLVNEAYKPLFGYSEMTKGQIDRYINEYLPILDLNMVTLVEDANNELVGVGISMASLSRALQKAKGRLWPFGWWHLLKALFIKRPPILDLLLIAVKPEYQGKGVNAIMFADLIPIYIKYGFEWGETNPELEVNDKIQSQWHYLDNRIHKRRRCYTKEI